MQISRLWYFPSLKYTRTLKYGMKYLLIPNSRGHVQWWRGIFSITGCWEDALSTEMKKDIESHWRDKIRVATCCSKHQDLSKPHCYVLSMFPYPSGRLHMGHVRVYAISDAVARFHRLNGKNVIHPMGWDAFGLPAENAARKSGEKADAWTYNNIRAMKDQLLQMNFSFNWDREFDTCDPEYYKWTQHLFLLMYEKGLIYRRKAMVYWDPVDRTVLADEQVDDSGRSWRSGAKVEKCYLTQWFIRATALSKQLYDALFSDLLPKGSKAWEEVKNVQKNWIGECNGFIFDFKLQLGNKILDEVLQVWTDKPELLFGATFITVTHEHFLNHPEYEQNVKQGTTKLLDINAIHPITGDPIPILITGSLECAEATQSHLGIPCANEQDHAFAKQHGIDIREVVKEDMNGPILINSGDYSGLPVLAAREKMCKTAQERNLGGYQSSKHLHDWVISRQRYWGTPIPLIHCEACKVVPVPKDQLPVVLPQLEKILDDGDNSPLEKVTEWVNVQCPQCGGPAKREVDTMDTFVDSSWYYLRFLDPHNREQMFDASKVNALMPVNVYIGGTEHTSQHLYYARVISHFLHNSGLLKQPEPFHKLVMVGMMKAQAYRIQGSHEYLKKGEVNFKGDKPCERATGRPVVVEWDKMSKSKLNGIDPEWVIKEDGIDSTRLFVLANHPPRNPIKWKKRDVRDWLKWQGFLWSLMGKYRKARADLSKDELPSKNDEFESILWQKKNRTIAITADAFEDVTPNIAISALNKLTIEMWNVSSHHASTSVYEHTLAALIIMLYPLMPHFASELWAGFADVADRGAGLYDVKKPVFEQNWPSEDKDYPWELEVKVNGALKTSQILQQHKTQNTPDENSIVEMALNMEKIQKILANKPIKSTSCCFLPGRIAEFSIFTMQSK